MLRAGSLLGHFCFLIVWAVVIVGAADSDAPVKQAGHMERWYAGEFLVCFILVSALLAMISVALSDDQRGKRISRIVDWLLAASMAFMIFVIVDAGLV